MNNKRCFVCVHFFNPAKNIRQYFTDFNCALVFLNEISSLDVQEIVDIKLEIDHFTQLGGR